MDIAFWDDEFRSKVDQLRTDISSLSRFKAGSLVKGQAVEKCELLVSSIETKTRRTYKMELRQLDAKTKPAYQQKLESYDKEVEKLKMELKWASKDALLGEQPLQDADVSKDQMLSKASELQDKTENSLARTLNTAREMNEIGEETLQNLEGQTQQMQKIDDGLQSINAELDKAQELLKSLIRRIMTDKLVLCFAGLIFLVIVGIVIYVAVRPEEASNFNVPTVVIPPIDTSG